MMSFNQWGNALYSGEKSYNIVGRRTLFVRAAVAVIALMAAIIAFLGLNLSIEFTGGSQFTITGASAPVEQVAHDTLKQTGITTDVRATSLGSDGMRVQTEALETTKAREVRQSLADAYGVQVESVQYESIGPSWGKDVTYQAALSLIIFMALVSLLMTIYFRSWTMSLSAVVALLHDVFMTVGMFALLRAEVSPATVIGFLTILGYSLYDTVVVFDKVRELTVGVWDQKNYTFAERVNLAVNQTMVRSINTSIVALLPVGAILFIGLYLLGAGTLIDISLALFIGMIVGTYSSIFIASTVLVALEMRRSRTRQHSEMVESHRVKHEGKTIHVSKTESLTADAPEEAVRAGRRLSNTEQPSRKKRKKR